MILVPFLLHTRLSANCTVQSTGLYVCLLHVSLCLYGLLSYCDLTPPESLWSIFSPRSLENIHVFLLATWFLWWGCGIWKSKGFNCISFYFHWWKGNNQGNLTSGMSLFLKSRGLSLTDKIFCCQDLASIVFVVWCQTSSLNANEQSMACILFLIDYAYTFCGQQKGNSRPIWFPFWHTHLLSTYKPVSIAMYYSILLLQWTEQPRLPLLTLKKPCSEATSLCSSSPTEQTQQTFNFTPKVPLAESK